MGTSTVSVVLPTLNERPYIRDCLDSLLAQDHPAIVEILVCDGGSTDGTREIVAGAPAPVRLVENPGVTAAAGMNAGIAAATGDVICRADAHGLYAMDYVRQCVEVLEETGADNVGGPMVPVGTTAFGRAVAAATSSPLGVGPGRFHYSTRREYVDTVYLGAWRRGTLEALGGYDEENLQWAAEDHELNFRITAGGGRIVLDPSIHSVYFPRSTVRSLARQYRNYGVGKVSTLAKHRRLPTWRPLAPAALVGISAVGFLTRRGWQRAAVPLAHGGVVVSGAARIGRGKGVSPWRAFVAIETCHWAYGVGVLVGLGRVLTGRGFDTRPSGHR